MLLAIMEERPETAVLQLLILTIKVSSQTNFSINMYFISILLVNSAINQRYTVAAESLKVYQLFD